ncbi:DNA translocase FtsK 4TM domain-containing protein [Paenibacillus cisolokensis]|uniref:DNA translocase FtsK n=1 Tax=Paenibacillus cisolokensis TaxID=1658519 RepID=UPI003D2E619E
MAKRRRKRSSLGTSLKYEVYGILLITISVIALSGEATVGRSLSKLFGLVLGKFYFVLALVGIYIGLAVMVKRRWPTGWSQRKSGLVLLVLALTLFSSIAEIDAKLAGAEGVTWTTILNQLGDDIRGALLSGAGNPDEPMMQKAISGGYVGAIQYSILFGLFGYFGAKFVMIVMFAISVMLITGRSYVEMAKLGKEKLQRLYTLLRAKYAASRKTRRPVAPAAVNVKAASPVHTVHSLPDDEEDDEENEGEDEQYAPEAEVRRPKKRAMFFQWFLNDGGKERNRSGDEEEPAESGTEEHPLYSDSGGRSAWMKEEERENALHADEHDRDDEDEEPPWDEEDEKGRPTTAPDWEREWPPVESATESAERFADMPEGAGKSPSPAELSEALVDADGGGGTEGAPAAPVPAKPYRLPPISLLNRSTGSGRGNDAADTAESRRKLEATLESFGVRAKVLDVVRGPAVTRYEVQPATGVKVSRIVGLTDDIALALAAKDIRMEAPIPGKSAIGIEVPNTEVSIVTMREVMEMPAFLNAPSRLSIAFGRDISGQPIVGNLAKMPHLLVAGATGSGKSVCINGIIASILYKAKPDEVKFMMIDPKMVELNVYNGIPHLLAPVVTDPRRASLALKKIVVEMEKRYELFSKSGTRNIEGYNTLMADNPAAVLPYIVVIVDELADLMMVAANDVEDSICRLAQMARAAGIHLIIATQRPSVDVITGVIKANIPSRIAFGVSSQVDSRTILDMAGAEKLLGRGDMLFLPVGMSKPIRVQGAFLSDQEVEAIVSYVRSQGEAEYNNDLVPEADEIAADEDEMLDELYDQAVQIVLEAKQASVSLLQRRMRIGYTRAARLIDQMEAKGVVGPYEGSKPRDVLISSEQYHGRISS